ncbi:hypothetical protein G8V03_15035 [Clostridium botulinum D/C]|uniref:hypothetical protein n=1 Tax=Clostridium botulinum TaxID=1491 RepID=UPI001E29FB0D|nr:hypothetical protein [Clostridium botulinum]MCD3352241.1 hypothetical protein [Clostridium botulinum D/C]MCD3361197.1 hypothetical protein [Clostridium botulinum D/C]MCD3366947.1 hypothetical protein [Clostridium botulinum D/C]
MLFAMALAVSIPHFNVYASETDSHWDNKFTVNNNITTSDAIKMENYNNKKDLIDIENL